MLDEKADETRSVVVVHDDQAFRNHVAARLSVLAIDIAHMTSAEASATLLRQLRPAVLVLGVSMEARDSIELLRDVAALESPPAVMLVQTGLWEIAQIARSCARALGVQRVVVLPRHQATGPDEWVVSTVLGLLAAWCFNRYRAASA